MEEGGGDIVYLLFLKSAYDPNLIARKCGRTQVKIIFQKEIG